MSSRVGHTGWRVTSMRHVKKLYKRTMPKAQYNKTLNWDRIERNLFQFMGSKPWSLPGRKHEWAGARVTATLNVLPEPMKIDGILLDRKTAGKKSRLNATIDVYEPDDSPMQNPRIYNIPMDHPNLKIEFAKRPGQQKLFRQAKKDWDDARKNKP
eukprot:NODE_3035_length_607_cov_65.003584_g2537_i0.p1 GENE.NODE_3035_length_607_cov_65.003584_g2537_i0~~NODE_3035_length_607_cov_65.003584_g2537_i0.p1  ORF type:complete len:175 (-),score=53.59 NODE_3035_length_607_cov_65.003584_g2537_i0:82-546(-)